MEDSFSFQIRYNENKIFTAYEVYFRFQRNKVLLNPLLIAQLLIGLGLVAFGVISDKILFTQIGIAISFMVSYIFIRIHFRSKKYFRNFLKNIENSPLKKEGSYTLQIDKNGLTYISSQHRNFFSWGKMAKPMYNGNAVYLHLKSRQMLDVFTSELNGEKEFEELKKRIKNYLK